MPYGYNNRNSYRGSTGYRPSSRNYAKRPTLKPAPQKPRRPEREKRETNINFKRIRNRVIIIGSALLILALIVILLVNTFSCICASSAKSGKGAQPAQAAQDSGQEEQPQAVDPDTQSTDTKADTAAFKAPKIKDKDTGSAGVKDGNMYVWNKACFEPFYGENDKAEEYAGIINSAKKTLGKDINVYTAIVPNHTEMGLPDRLKNTKKGIATNSQADYIKAAYDALDSSVAGINIYNKLSAHCNEYIYFNSDHHWTGLGAYYGYTAFTDATGQKPISLDDMTDNSVKGFKGSFTDLVKSKLKSDTVHFWSMPFDVKNKWTDMAGNVDTAETMYYWYAEPGRYTYGVFLFGDNPLEYIKSKSKNAKNEAIAIVHESYGNAIVPYFTNNYKEVYSIDFRYWDGNLKSFCKKNNIQNVLFVNGVMSSATESLLVQLKSVI